jgi:hypothetical protein
VLVLCVLDEKVRSGALVMVSKGWRDVMDVVDLNVYGKPFDCFQLYEFRFEFAHRQRLVFQKCQGCSCQ